MFVYVQTEKNTNIFLTLQCSQALSQNQAVKQVESALERADKLSKGLHACICAFMSAHTYINISQALCNHDVMYVCMYFRIDIFTRTHICMRLCHEHKKAIENVFHTYHM
jgi:hypothetical protein